VDAGTSGPFSVDQIKDAQLTWANQDTNSCLPGEPPLAAAKVQTLFYDPTVSYYPPPSPAKIAVGLTYPNNLLDSMTSGYTAAWTKVPKDGTKLSAAGLATAPASLAAADRVSLFALTDVVWCDTRNQPTRKDPLNSASGTFASTQAWLESNRCRRNTLGVNTVAKAPNYPYVYPAKTNGGSLQPSITSFLNMTTVDHQVGQLKFSKNPVYDTFNSPANPTPSPADNPNAFYVFAQTYNNSAPYYYNVKPIEYCTNSKLNDCKLVKNGAPTGVYIVPAYVRYCKTTAQATDTSAEQGATACQGVYTGASGGIYYHYPRYGLFERVDVVLGGKYGGTDTNSDGIVDATYATRTDCGSAAGCSYEKEMENYANWYAYYRTRIQLMKTAIGRTFNELDKPETPLPKDESKDYRVGLITVEGFTNPGNYLPIDDFLGGGLTSQRAKFYLSAYSRVPSGGTSLRNVLSAVGRVYAGRAPDVGLPVGDPMQHSCQQNYTLLTTDGYWNGETVGKKVDGSDIGNQDADPTPFPQREGNVVYGAPSLLASHTDTLADVAAYYYNTDLRNKIKFNNCIGVPVPPNVVGNEVCDDNAGVDKATQRMTTFTLGLGVDGLLNSTGYKAGTSVDFEALKLGLTLRWPSPGPEDNVAPFTEAERATVDDLWHAAVNGAESDRSQYFNARNPQDVIDGVRSALASLGDKKGTASTTSLSNVTPSGSDNLAFSTRYYTGTWTGNLFARMIDGQGVLNANAVWCVEDESDPACQKGPPTAQTLLDKAHAGNRKIWASNGTGLVKFEYNLLGSNQIHFQTGNISGLSQWSGFDSTQKGLAKEDNLVKYLSGKNDYEQTASTAADRLYRTREKILGDIIDSDPTFVGKAKYDFLDDNYTAFKLSTASRAETVYVGANDGMLHAFNAQTGEERWAFVPSAVMKNMWKLADNNYRNLHTNFVNGKITVADVCPTAPTTPCSAAQWRTILVSGLGQGGRGYFALDITESLKNAVNPPELLWEFDSSTESNLGYSYGRPIITKKMDGKWVVVLTSGYNNTDDGKGRLFILDAMTGNQSLSGGISTGEGGSTYPSGLAQIAGFATSPNANNQTQYIYGGDLLGNLWRFDIDDRSSNLNANTVFKLTNISPRKITVTPTLSEIKGKRVIFVGSGKYLESADLDPQNYEQERLYTFTDAYITTTLTEAQLLARLEPQTLSAASGGTRTGSGNSPDWSDSLTNWGWYADLPGSLSNGERQNVKASLISGILFVATIIPPTGTCDISGKAWTNMFDFQTGGVISSFQSDSPIAGFYFVFSDPTDDKVAVGIDYTDGRSQNASPPPSAVPCTSNCVDAVPPRFDLLGTSGAFVGDRAIWRELVE
jgi:type IV pilus assembly protein PilY1